MIDWSVQHVYFPPTITTYGGKAITGATPPTGATVSEMDSEGIVQACFDPTNDALRVTNSGIASGATNDSIDGDQVWQHVYDPATNTVRVVLV